MERYILQQLFSTLTVSNIIFLQISVATVEITWVILIFLVGIIVFAHPGLRSKSHDTFERVHRFMGWTATALVWAQVVSLTNDWKGDASLGYALVHSAPMWLMFIITGKDASRFP